MYSYSEISVTNSCPAELKKILPLNQQGYAYYQFSYKGMVLGFHYLFGIEAPLTKVLSFSLEWMVFYGETGVVQALYKKTKNSKLEKESRGQTIDTSGQKLLFGLNYLLEI